MNDDPAILSYAQTIIDAPDEWTPNYTRAELLPMARAYALLNKKGAPERTPSTTDEAEIV